MDSGSSIYIFLEFCALLGFRQNVPTYKYNFTGASFTLAMDCQKGYFFHVYFDWKKNYVNYEYHIVFIGSL